MFTALVTAMLGAFWLDRIGFLDLRLVYMPETFVIPQAVGGALFGAGFLLGGLCPGTSCVAAATGRLDGRRRHRGDAGRRGGRSTPSFPASRTSTRARRWAP